VIDERDALPEEIPRAPRASAGAEGAGPKREPQLRPELISSARAHRGRRSRRRHAASEDRRRIVKGAGNSNGVVRHVFKSLLLRC
jgi:hypothetical protein